ncbi:dihydropteroate synthase [Anaeromicropila populeti]
MRIGNRNFSFGNHTYVMGILNVTPDSFSDGGKFRGIEKAVRHAQEMEDAGADIIDVGGESTRPSYTKISDEEEIKRVVPVIKELKGRLNIPISIDTYKSRVAKAALEAGADLVNDIWGLRYDSDMAGVIKEFDASVCIMHNREQASYTNFMEEVKKDIVQSLKTAYDAGIDKSRIMIDPGVGFAKTYEMNLTIIRELGQLLEFQLPILLGTSRKSVIGLTLDLPVTEREEGTLATTVMGVMAGCHFVRVHDVKGNVRAIKMTEAVRDSRLL